MEVVEQADGLLGLDWEGRRGERLDPFTHHFENVLLGWDLYRSLESDWGLYW